MSSMRTLAPLERIAVCGSVLEAACVDDNDPNLRKRVSTIVAMEQEQSFPRIVLAADGGVRRRHHSA